MTHLNGLRDERLDVLRRPPKHLKKRRNKLGVIPRHPL
jgi:hypothetical protein